MRLSEVLTKWEESAKEFRALSAQTDAAALCERFLRDLRRIDAESPEEYVTIAEAAKLSGHSEQNLRRLAKKGRVAAIKENGVLRVRAQDLPRRAGGISISTPQLHLFQATAEQAVRESVGSS